MNIQDTTSMALFTKERLFDLVRHQRAELHDAGLLTDTEYTALASAEGCVERLEAYAALPKINQQGEQIMPCPICHQQHTGTACPVVCDICKQPIVGASPENPIGGGPGETYHIACKNKSISVSAIQDYENRQLNDHIEKMAVELGKLKTELTAAQDREAKAVARVAELDIKAQMLAHFCDKLDAEKVELKSHLEWCIHMLGAKAELYKAPTLTKRGHLLTLARSYQQSLDKEAETLGRETEREIAEHKVSALETKNAELSRLVERAAGFIDPNLLTREGNMNNTEMAKWLRDKIANPFSSVDRRGQRDY